MPSPASRRRDTQGDTGGADRASLSPAASPARMTFARCSGSSWLHSGMRWPITRTGPTIGRFLSAMNASRCARKARIDCELPLPTPMLRWCVHHAMLCIAPKTHHRLAFRKNPPIAARHSIIHQRRAVEDIARHARFGFERESGVATIAIRSQADLFRVDALRAVRADDHARGTRRDPSRRARDRPSRF